ncbi:MAG: L-ribulose-5-phosphate 4-epimerase AraD [Fibrobacter sp.]|nr:L-ribulose-5-phosphate 4-epimerase AraD [Fibrobacter sp.]
MMSIYKEIKEQAWLANLELPKRGLVIYTFGNVSAFDKNRGVFAIKPSGIDYDKLSVDDMIVVDLDNNTVEGALRYSSDTKTHSVLYKNFPDITGIVHTHSTYSVAWAQACRSIPVYGTTHADHLADDIPCTPVIDKISVQGNYEEETGKLIVKAFENLSYKKIQMVLVARHGPFTWGETPEKAVYNSVVLEELAKMAQLTENIHNNVTRLEDWIITKHYERKHGKNAYYGQNGSIEKGEK